MFNKQKLTWRWWSLPYRDYHRLRTTLQPVTLRDPVSLVTTRQQPQQISIPPSTCPTSATTMMSPMSSALSSTISSFSKLPYAIYIFVVLTYHYLWHPVIVANIIFSMITSLVKKLNQHMVEILHSVMNAELDWTKWQVVSMGPSAGIYLWMAISEAHLYPSCWYCLTKSDFQILNFFEDWGRYSVDGFLL